MIKQECKFYVQGAGWDMLVEESSAISAATSAFEAAYSEFGKNIKVSPSIIVIDLCKTVDGDCEGSVSLIETASVLADAGLHQLSKQFKKIIRND
jgi:ribosomal protein L20A (L18A)